MKNLSIYFTAFALLAGAVSCDLTEAPQAKAGRDMIFGSETGLKNYTYGFSLLPVRVIHYLAERHSGYLADSIVQTFNVRLGKKIRIGIFFR